jgi:enoyl-CoA hydratase
MYCLIEEIREETVARKHILFEHSEGIAWLTFNRPKVLNALNMELLEEFSQLLSEIEKDESIRVLILTGAGDRSFVAGADIGEISQCNVLQGKLFAEKGQGVLNHLQSLSIPVIAAVNGYALGGGTEIALACDFVYAADNATFGLPEITLGIIPGFGGTQRLPRLIGQALAKEMIFTGKMIAAAEAKTIGLVNKVCPSGELRDEVLKTAKKITEKGKVCLRAAKQAINSGIHSDLTTGLRIEADAFSICMASIDAREGTTAFLEKRQAKFSGGLTQ